MKKDIIWFSGLIALCLSVIFAAGCSTFHEPTPTTTTLPPHDFLGIQLGDTTADVVSELGQPDSTEQIYNILYYNYDSAERAVLFETPSTGVVTVISANGGDDLNGIRVGQTEEHIRALLGEAGQVKTGDLTHMWVYSDYKIFVSFLNSTDKVVGMGLYWPGKGDIDPD